MGELTWRPATRYLGIWLAMAAFFGAIVSLDGTWWAGLIPGGMLLALGAGIEIQACWRLHRTIAAFADEIGGTPESEASWSGTQRARWDDPPVEIEGRIGHRRMFPHVETVSVVAGERSWTIPAGKGRQAAREALVKLGRRSPAGSWDGEVPGPGPVVATLVGAVWAGLAAGGSTLAILDWAGLSAMPWLLLAAVPTVLVAAASGWYNRRSRRALVALVEGVRSEGLTVADVTHTGGRVMPGFDLYTPEGVVDVVASWSTGGGPAFVARIVEDDEVEEVPVPFSSAEQAGRRVGRRMDEMVGW